MPSFDIVRKSEIGKTYRTARVASDYDYSREVSEEHFVGKFDLPEEWNIGLIVGASGTGKTTIARELFGDDLVDGFEYTHESVIDDMPKDCSVDDITRCFYQVGFGSVPSWLRPYSVLSNGEKMRCDLARAILGRDFTVFDEFTSVVDRNVAKTVSAALAKGIRKSGKKFVAVSCHRDVIEWLQPDWVFDTDVMRPLPVSRLGQGGSMKYMRAPGDVGRYIGSIIT